MKTLTEINENTKVLKKIDEQHRKFIGLILVVND